MVSRSCLKNLLDSEWNYNHNSALQTFILGDGIGFLPSLNSLGWDLNKTLKLNKFAIHATAKSVMSVSEIEKLVKDPMKITCTDDEYNNIIKEFIYFIIDEKNGVSDEHAVKLIKHIFAISNIQDYTYCGNWRYINDKGLIYMINENEVYCHKHDDYEPGPCSYGIVLKECIAYDHENPIGWEDMLEDNMIELSFDTNRDMFGEQIKCCQR